MRQPILQQWQEVLATRGEAPAIWDAGGKVVRTFHDIEVRALDWAERIELPESGGVLGVQTGNHPDFPSLFLACLRRQWVMLPLEPGLRNRQEILHTCGAEGVVEIGEGKLEWHRTQGDVGPIAVPGLALLKLTSGTSGLPRGVCFSETQLEADCATVCDTMGLRADDRNLGVISLSHSYGFSNLVTPLLCRGIPMVLASDPMPRAVAHAVARIRPTVFPGVPALFEALVALPNPPDLSSLRLCISAGAPLSLDVQRRFKELFGRKLHSFYGSSECGGICYDAAEDLPEVDGFVGGPMKGVELRELDSGVPGQCRIEVRGPGVATGYYPTGDEALQNGVFRPADLLRRVEAGYVVAGRIGDLINVAGRKVHPGPVEEVLKSVPGVRQVAVFGVPDASRNERLVAGVVADAAVTDADLLALCQNNLDPWQIPKLIWRRETLPVNARGKLSRAELRELYLAGGRKGG